VKIRVEVVYALRDEQMVVALDLEGGATVADALIAVRGQMAIPGGFPDVGIWGVRVTPETGLRDGDRVELYRNLVADPKQVRRSRAGVQRARSRR
jgi:putative ubiquitin-RnfH superfamily antitoxin RatB of RatAB toxin-antitoxin module